MLLPVVGKDKKVTILFAGVYPCVYRVITNYPFFIRYNNLQKNLAESESLTDTFRARQINN